MFFLVSAWMLDDYAPFVRLGCALLWVGYVKHGTVIIVRTQTKTCHPKDLLVNLKKLGFSQKLFFHNFKWNSGGLGVSRRTAPTVRCYLQSFSRFGGTWYQKVNFSTFDGKLTFQCTRNGLQNHQFCPGSLQDTFIIYSSISHQHIFRTYFAKTKSRESKF